MEFESLPDGWEIVKLESLLSLLTDYHANGSYEILKKNVELMDTPDYAAMIRTTNFEKNDFEDLKYINENAYHFLSKSKVMAGDIVMNKIANAGTSYYVPDMPLPISLGMNLFLLRINDKADQRYVYYYLKANETYVKSFANGTSTTTITKQAVKELDIRLPSLKTQKKISSLIGALDDKIALNNQINKTFEMMAKALFKSWFVDFYPFANEEFEESELGMIPKEWKVGCIGDLFSFINGYPFKSLSYVEDGQFGVITIKNVQDGKFENFCANHIDEIPSNFNAECYINNGDILMSLTGNVGRVCIASDGKFVLNQRVVKLKSIHNYTAYTYFFFRSENTYDRMLSIAKGTAQQNLSPVETKALKIAVPPLHILDEFEKICRPLFDRISLNNNNTIILSTIRDALLPKLMSGEIELNITEVN